VVGDEVDDHAEAVGVGLIGEAPEGFLAAELRGQARRVDDVVAVGRAGAGGHERRQIEMAGTECP